MKLKSIGKACPFKTDLHPNQRALHNTPYFQKYYLVSKDLFRPLNVSLISSSTYPALIQPSNDLQETLTNFPTLITWNGSCFCRPHLKINNSCSGLTIVLLKTALLSIPFHITFHLKSR